MNLNLIKGLQFAEKLNMTEAITESGKEFLKSYRGYLYTNPASYGLVNGFISEACSHKYDNGIASILESVLKYVTENKISWKIASACEIIENSNDGKVRVGSVVTIKYDGDDEEEEYTIVGTNEADPFENKISNESPIAVAVLGKKQGDVVTVESPNGSFDVEIVKVA